MLIVTIGMDKVGNFKTKNLCQYCYNWHRFKVLLKEC